MLITSYLQLKVYACFFPPSVVSLDLNAYTMDLPLKVEEPEHHLQCICIDLIIKPLLLKVADVDGAVQATFADRKILRRHSWIYC